MIRAGIIGAAGYTGGELARLLLHHPEATLAFAQSESHAGQPLWSAHADLLGETELCFCAEAPYAEADVLFLCTGHGRAREAVAALPAGYAGRIIDLSQDFRLRDSSEGFVYGLPEAFRSRIAGASRIANPGCFATAIQLAFLPLAAADALGRLHVTGITGSTGAGQKPSPTTHFSWRSDNVSVYKPFTHQHLAEVKETLSFLAPSWDGEIDFVPLRGPFTRGILVSAYLDSPLSQEAALQCYEDYYRDAPFSFVTDADVDLKMAVGTNKCVLSVNKYGGKLHIVSVIDNLLKGASGQAVQNMNLSFGLDERCGLQLKGNRY